MTYLVEKVDLEVNVISYVEVLAGHRDITLETVMLGDTTGRSRSVDGTRNGWDLRGDGTDGEFVEEGIATGHLSFALALFGEEEFMIVPWRSRQGNQQDRDPC